MRYQNLFCYRVSETITVVLCWIQALLLQCCTSLDISWGRTEGSCYECLRVEKIGSCWPIFSWWLFFPVVAKIAYQKNNFESNHAQRRHKTSVCPCHVCGLLFPPSSTRYLIFNEQKVVIFDGCPSICAWAGNYEPAIMQTSTKNTMNLTKGFIGCILFLSTAFSF